MSLGRIAQVLSSAFIAVGLAIGLSAPAVAAQSVAITPTSSEQTIQPGSQAKGTVQVLNQADTPFTFKMYAAPYSVNGEEYDPSFTPIPGATQVTAWVKLGATSNSLASYSGARVDYSITVPADAKPGGYYAVIFAETQSKVEGSGVATLKRVGTILYIRVAGAVAEAGSVASWQVGWLQQPNLLQLLRVQNTGSVFYTADIHTTVRDVFGRSKFSYAQKRKILPEKIRRIAIKWDKTPAIGLFVVSGEVGILGKTSQLPSKYVLVLSHETRVLILILAGIVIFFAVLKHILARRSKGKKNVVGEVQNTDKGGPKDEA